MLSQNAMSVFEKLSNGARASGLSWSSADSVASVLLGVSASAMASVLSLPCSLGCSLACSDLPCAVALDISLCSVLLPRYGGNSVPSWEASVIGAVTMNRAGGSSAGLAGS